MVPSARLLVYYIVTGEQTAELVADSVWINVEEKCGNQLQVRHACTWRHPPHSATPLWVKEVG